MRLGGFCDGAWASLGASLGWFGSGKDSIGGAFGRLEGCLDVLGSLLDLFRDPCGIQNAWKSKKHSLAESLKKRWFS